MGIKVEFNPELALRANNTSGRLESECLPYMIREGQEYEFLKTGQRNYWLQGDVTLLKTLGEGQISEPLAQIRILEVTHFTLDGEIYTKGKYKVTKLMDSKR